MTYLFDDGFWNSGKKTEQLVNINYWQLMKFMETILLATKNELREGKNYMNQS